MAGPPSSPAQTVHARPGGIECEERHGERDEGGRERDRRVGARRADGAVALAAEQRRPADETAGAGASCPASAFQSTEAGWGSASPMVSPHVTAAPPARVQQPR
eukprot:scaffold61873_cov64-Phaeocystis_antarctica.AAC.1